MQATSYHSYDALLATLADYICAPIQPSELAIKTAQYCLMDSLGCAMLALNYPACTKLLGPWVLDCTIKNGARVIGTHYELDPIKAAFDNTALIRWLDFNDTWLAQEWGHPSDNFGGLLAVMDFVCRSAQFNTQKLTIYDLLISAIKAYEIQGMLAIENSFNRVGLDHVILVKVASCGLMTKIMGGHYQQILASLSQAWLDGQSLRTYRHAPNTGTRKSWAAGDAVSRAVRLALLTLQGEMGYFSALSAPKWGFEAVYMQGEPVKLTAKLSDYVMENILFKIAYPAEFHAQTAVECAIALHSKCHMELNQIDRVVIQTHEAAIRIIDKKGKLNNPADRDHCLQYMVAVALMMGDLKAEYYEDDFAKNLLIDQLREVMVVEENTNFSQDYLNPKMRSIANTVTVYLKNGDHLSETCEYPLGHKRRRIEALPLLKKKFCDNLNSRLSQERTEKLLALMDSEENLWDMELPKFINHWLA